MSELELLYSPGCAFGGVEQRVIEIDGVIKYQQQDNNVGGSWRTIRIMSQQFWNSFAEQNDLLNTNDPAVLAGLDESGFLL